MLVLYIILVFSHPSFCLFQSRMLLNFSVKSHSNVPLIEANKQSDLLCCIFIVVTLVCLLNCMIKFLNDTLSFSIVIVL